MILIVSGALGPADHARAEILVSPYVEVQGGVSLWPAYSNRDEVEADTGPGFSGALLGGVELSAPEADRVPGFLERVFRERFSTRIELEANYRYAKIHGVNDGSLQRTGDGKTLRAISALVNVWPTWKFAEGFHVYAGGGGGGTFIRALGSDKRVWNGQVGLGLLIGLPIERVDVQLDLGWRSFFANSTKLRDGLTDFDTHGGVIGFQLGF